MAAAWGRQAFPLRSPGTPEGVAKAIYYLCTDQSSYVTGAELHITAGNMCDIILGFLLSMAASIAASFAVGPLLQAPWSFRFVVLMARYFAWTAPRFLRRGDWEFAWEVTSDNFPPTNVSGLRWYAFLSVVAAEWTASSLSSDMRTYRMVARLSGSNKLTARWFEKDHNSLGYLGALQAVFNPMGTLASGLWIGFASDNSVKSGTVHIRALRPVR